MLPDRDLIFHSTLRDACRQAEDGWLTIRLTGRRGRVIEARGRTVAPFQLEGEDRERRYLVEDDAIRAQLETLQVNVPVRVRASGGKDGQKLEVTDLDGDPVEQGQPTASKAEASRRAPNDERGPIRREAWASLLVAHGLVQKYVEEFGHLPPAGVVAIFGEVFRERNMSRGAPFGSLDTKVLRPLPVAEGG